MIKVMIVDDSALIRRILTDILNTDDEISVIATARNGKEALEKIETLKPDLVTLDIEMPIMDGITALKHIVNRYKIPVIMISTLSKEGAELTLKALDEGAVDFLPKPNNVFKLSQEEIAREIIDKIKAGSKSKIFDKKPVLQRVNTIDKKNNKYVNGEFSTIVSIGSSTGGPRALQDLLSGLPKDINASIVIAQHMPSKFTKSLADRLDSISQINVKEAEEGDILKRGYAYIAPGDYHMKIVEERIGLVVRLNKNPKVMGLRPTVDNLMESVSNINKYFKIGIILTGMGSDGAKGIQLIKNCNSYTIAQDEESSIVYGMPRAAILTGSIDKILSIDKIADEVINKVGV